MGRLSQSSRSTDLDFNIDFCLSISWNWPTQIHWKLKIGMMSTLSSFVAPEIFVSSAWFSITDNIFALRKLPGPVVYINEYPFLLTKYILDCIIFQQKGNYNINILFETLSLVGKCVVKINQLYTVSAIYFRCIRPTYEILLMCSIK